MYVTKFNRENKIKFYIPLLKNKIQSGDIDASNIVSCSKKTAIHLSQVQKMTRDECRNIYLI